MLTKDFTDIDPLQVYNYDSQIPIYLQSNVVRQTMNSDDHSLKYQRFIQLGWKDKLFGKFDFVAHGQFLYIKSKN